MSRIELCTTPLLRNPGSPEWVAAYDERNHVEQVALAVHQADIAKRAVEWANQSGPATMADWFEEFGKWCGEQLAKRTGWDQDPTSMTYHTRFGTFPAEWKRYMDEEIDDGLGDDADHEEEL